MVVKSFKQAFTMIELVFAIVVIAIAVLAMPQMMQATSSGLTSNLETQEAIFKAVVLTKTAIGENNFNSIDNVEQVAHAAISNVAVGLTEYKFKHYYTLQVDDGQTFNGQAVAKRITTTIFRADGTTVASFVAYIFNY